MKRILTVLCVLSLLVLLAGCFGLGGSGDWDYPLPNGYVVMRINAVDIILGQQEKTYSVGEVIPRYVAGFSFNKRFVGVKRLPIEGGMDINYDEAMKLIENYDPESLEYYLVDTETDTVLGPFDAAGYAAACEESGVGDLGDWIETSSIHWNSPEVNTYGGKK